MQLPPRFAANDLFPAFVPSALGSGWRHLRVIEGRARPFAIGVVLHDFALGGTERIAIRLANRWATDGADVTLFVGVHDGPLATLLDPRVRLIEAEEPIRRAWRSPHRLASAAARYFSRCPVDACFVPGNYHWPVAGALSRIKGSDRPVVAVQISAALRKPQRNALQQCVYNLRMRRLVVGADVAVAMCVEAGQQADHILRRPMSVPILLPALDEDMPSPRSIERECGMILAAGRLVREKGFDLLIDAFARIVRRGGHPNARLVILGEGPERRALEAMIAAHGLGKRVSIPGYVPDIRPWLDEARLFVLSSRFEGYGAVVIEALAAGRPVVATRCTPAVRALLREETVGRSVPIEDSLAMADAIAGMLSDPVPDPARLAALVEHHRIGAVARQYLDLFQRLSAG